MSQAVHLATPPSLHFPELAKLLGDRYTENNFERAFYRRDLAFVPPILEMVLARTLPQCVARPRDADEVAALVRGARTHQLAITPRAAATTVYWNSVPTRAGIVIDLNDLRGIVSINAENLTATVLPATRWGELDAALRRRGLATRTYPTSAPSATVGGWVSMEGFGIGSLQFGGLAQQLIALDVVLPDGRAHHATRDSDPPLSWFLGSEGTLGIITAIELAIRRAPEKTGKHLVALRDLVAVQNVARALAQSAPTPYNLHFSDAAHLRLLRAAGFAPPTEQAMLLITYEGDANHIAAGAQNVYAIAQKFGGEILPDDLAAREWGERFAALRVKRAGPTVLGSETWLRADRLAEYCADVAHLANQQRVTLATYGTLVTQDEFTVMTVYPSDESRQLAYIFDLSLTKQLYDLAFRRGGRPYGIGFWNAPYRHRAMPAHELAERRARKRQLDPTNGMNPDKIFVASPILSPLIFSLGMNALAWARRVGGAWR